MKDYRLSVPAYLLGNSGFREDLEKLLSLSSVALSELAQAGPLHELERVLTPARALEISNATGIEPAALRRAVRTAAYIQRWIAGPDTSAGELKDELGGLAAELGITDIDDRIEDLVAFLRGSEESVLASETTRKASIATTDRIEAMFVHWTLRPIMVAGTLRGTVPIADIVLHYDDIEGNHKNRGFQAGEEQLRELGDQIKEALAELDQIKQQSLDEFLAP